jgi:N-acetylglutamate synthase-like GNAT family acetyltransferase
MRGAATVVRPATPDDHRSIATLLDRVLGQQPYARRERVWEWRRQGVESSLPGFFVAVRDGAVIGAQGIQPIRMQVGDQHVVAACTLDYAVDSTARGGGLGTELKLRTTIPPTAELSISTTANAAAHRITRALGGDAVGDAGVTYTLPLRTTAAIARRIAARAPALAPAAHLVGPLGDLLLAGRRAAGPRRAPDGTDLGVVGTFDAAFDRLWERMSPRYPVQVIRDARYLNWRYRSLPGVRTHAVALYWGTEVLGLAVVAAPPPVAGLGGTAAIVELFDDGRERGTLEVLLTEAIRHAARGGLEKIVARTSNPKIARLLRLTGFAARPEDPSPVTYLAANSAMASVLSDDSGWHLSLGDGDAWI